MYAIVATGGKQIRVQAGQILRLETLNAQVGDLVSFDQILAIGGGEGGEGAIGTPYVSGAKVTGKVIELGREKKIIIFKKVRRSQYKRRNGHRQNYVAVRFEEIAFGGMSVKAEPRVEKAVVAAAPKAEMKAKAAPKKTVAKKAVNASSAKTAAKKSTKKAK